MSTRPRNPRYFPKMKVRGSRRRGMAPYQRTAGSFDRLGMAAEAATAAMQGVFAALDNRYDRY